MKRSILLICGILFLTSCALSEQEMIAVLKECSNQSGVRGCNSKPEKERDHRNPLQGRYNDYAFSSIRKG